MPMFGTRAARLAAEVNCLGNNIIIPASSLVTSAVVPICTADTGSYSGVILTLVVLRTTAAISGFTAPPTLTVGWSASIATNPFASAVVCPTAAGVATALLPPALMPYGPPGGILNLKVTNIPVGTGAGNLIVDLYGCQAP